MARDFQAASTEYLIGTDAPLGASITVGSCCIRGNMDNADDGSTLMSLVDVSSTSQYITLRAGDTGDVDSKIHLIRRDGGGENKVSTSTEFTAGTYFSGGFRLTAVNDVAVFLNGAGKGTGTTSISPTGIDTVGVGRLVDDSPGDEATGDICELAFYDRALTDAEFLSWHKGARPSSMAGLVRHWPIWGLHSPEIDVTGKGVSLTVTGTPLRSDHAPTTLFTPKWAATSPVIGVAAPAGRARRVFSFG